MIQRPRRSVTRFFIPLIDVLILLFCIFLLMPFVSQAGNSDPAPEEREPVEQPKDEFTLKEELDAAKRELKRLQAQQGELADRLAIKILEVDLPTGHLIHFVDGERREIADQKGAEEVIDAHIRASGTREPLFLILLPKRGAPQQQHIDNYRRWFARVNHGFDESVVPRGKEIR